MAEVELSNVENVTGEVPKETNALEEKVEPQTNSVDVATKTSETQGTTETAEGDEDTENVEEKENLSQHLSQSAPVAVVPPTKRVHQDSQTEDEEKDESPLKKSKVLEENSNVSSQEIPAQ